MFHNVLMTTLTPLCDTNELQQWENRPFVNKWPESNQSKPHKEPTVIKTIKKKNKRNRTAYTTEQLRVLEKTFTRTKYIDAERRKQLADCLGIGDKCIKVWFQNRRMKEKKEFSESSSDSSSECANEPVTPPPNNLITNNTNHYNIPDNQHCEKISMNSNEGEYAYYPFEGNVTSDSLHTAYYQNYNSVQHADYNAQLQTSEYFRNDVGIYPTQYYPQGPEYTNLDNQNDHQNNMYNWPATGFYLNYF